MTIALFSDGHGHLPALEAVLADIEQRQPDMIFCLGDLVDYASWPNEVVNEVRRWGIPTLAGNYDQGIGLASSNCGCAARAGQIIIRACIGFSRIFCELREKNMFISLFF